jgi:formate C-acetyltransferase
LETNKLTHELFLERVNKLYGDTIEILSEYKGTGYNVDFVYKCKHGEQKMTTQQEENLINLLDGYVETGGHHLNVNVFNRETLLDAQEHPEKYPQLTVRVSGYAVNFNKLTREQQDDVISRTFHGQM